MLKDILESFNGPQPLLGRTLTFPQFLFRAMSLHCRNPVTGKVHRISHHPISVLHLHLFLGKCHCATNPQGVFRHRYRQFFPLPYMHISPFDDLCLFDSMLFCHFIYIPLRVLKIKLIPACTRSWFIRVIQPCIYVDIYVIGIHFGCYPIAFKPIKASHFY